MGLGVVGWGVNGGGVLVGGGWVWCLFFRREWLCGAAGGGGLFFCFGVVLDYLGFLFLFTELGGLWFCGGGCEVGFLRGWGGGVSL